MLERLAVWYLKQRGRVVLPRLFVGMALGGNAYALREVRDDGGWSRWSVHLPAFGDLIALNGTMIEDKVERWTQEA